MSEASDRSPRFSLSETGPARLQVALDDPSLEENLRVAREVQSQVDLLEVGTPLIKKYGMEAVRRFREEFPEAVVVADMKTIDGGEFETRLAFGAGADVTTAMAVASSATLKRVVEETGSHGGGLMVDMLGVTAPARRLDQLSFLPPETLILLHVSADRNKSDQRTGLGRLLGQMDENRSRPVAVAGGIDPESVGQLTGSSIRVVIAGSAITGSDHPAETARKLRSELRA